VLVQLALTQRNHGDGEAPLIVTLSAKIAL
jgi:hypothetical protein